MLVRQCVSQCVNDLRNIESRLDDFDLSTEAFSRFLIYYRGVSAKDAVDCVTGYMSREQLRELREREPRNNY